MTLDKVHSEVTSEQTRLAGAATVLPGCDDRYRTSPRAELNRT